jgi:hypothetical protein
VVVIESVATPLLADVRRLIDDTRQRVAAAVNADLTVLHHQIGRRIQTEALGDERANYGDQVVTSLAAQLEGEYGRGFLEKNICHLLRFDEAFPDEAIVYAVRRQLS